MSEENVELIRRIFEAFNRGDLEGARAIANPPPEFEFVPSGVLIPDLADVQRGPEGFRRLEEAFPANFDDVQFELHELIDAGDRVFGSATLWGRGSHSGARRAGTSGAFGPCGTAAWFAGRGSRTGTKPRSRRAAGIGRHQVDV